MKRSRSRFPRGIAAMLAAVLLLLLAIGCSADDRNQPDESAGTISDGAGNGAAASGNTQADDGRTNDANSGAEGEDGEDGSSADADEAAAEEPAEPSVQTDIPSLAEVYADYFPIGAAIMPEQTEDLTAELLKKHVNMLVAENAMKPVYIQPTEGQFRFENADKLVEFAKANGMEMRYHTLVWHNQTPVWFFYDRDGNRMVDETDPEKREANKKLLLERLDKYVRTVVERYKDDIKSWDVVNEVIEPADPDGMRNSEWYQITGIDYIETAFRAAREAGGPDLKLYINDYNTNEPAKRDRLYELVKELLDRGVPIDGVGHQTHINVEWPSVDSIIESMQKFAELGLDNIVTEMDMSVYSYNDHRDYGDDVPEAVIQKQAQRYGELFAAFRDNPGLVSAVVFWGIADNHTWLHDFPVNNRTDAPLLFDDKFQAKPAFWAVVEPLLD